MAKPRPDAPRSEHKAYADCHGYFWLPCARCGKFWGGHEEWRGRIPNHIVAPNASTTTGTCCPDPPDGVEPRDQPARMLAARRARGEDV